LNRNMGTLKGLTAEQGREFGKKVKFPSIFFKKIKRELF